MGFCTALFSQSVPSQGLAPLTHFGKLSLPIAAQQPSPVGHKSESLVPKESLGSLCPLFPSKLRGEPGNLPSPPLPSPAPAQPPLGTSQVPARRAITGEVALYEPIGCPAAPSAQQKGSNYRRTF